MTVTVYEDHTALSTAVALELSALIRERPSAVICLASGDTPRLTCQLFAESAKATGLDYSACTFIGLDEWIGIAPSNPGSCHYFFHQYLFDPLGIPASQLHLFDALSPDLVTECVRMDSFIREKKGIDLLVVGIGMNGHIGFNEPGVSFDLYSHVIRLADDTVSVGQKYFSETTELRSGITLGLRHLSESRNVILMANGRKKAGVVRDAVQGIVSSQLPASIMQTIPQGRILLDKAAAALLA